MSEEMKETEQKVEEKKKCSCETAIDMKTFWVSFFTSVLVVLLYHFGTSLIQIYTDSPLKPNTRYMFVPVNPNPHGGMMERRGFGGEGRHFPGGGRRFHRNNEQQPTPQEPKEPEHREKQKEEL